MFDSSVAANVFAASVLFKMETRRGAEKTLSSRYYISMPADETEVSVSSAVPFGIPGLLALTPEILVHMRKKKKEALF